MTRRKKTDGERIAEKVFAGAPLYRYAPDGVAYPTVLAADIDRLIRRRMAEAWDEGNVSPGYLKDNPYRGRKKK